jgi:ATP-dependent RNA helicase DDX19/DBP5
MTKDGHVVEVLHAAHKENDRDAAMERFRSGKSKVLIATSVLARGIDVTQVNMVVNYDLPVDRNGNPDFDTYLHRIGRTGRLGRRGVSIAFTHDEKSLNELKAFEAHFKIQMVKIETTDLREMDAMINRGMCL